MAKISIFKPRNFIKKRSDVKFVSHMNYRQQLLSRGIKNSKKRSINKVDKMPNKKLPNYEYLAFSVKMVTTKFLVHQG